MGDPIRPEQILYDSSHSLIEQSHHAVKGLVTEEGTVPAPFTNGDGFGLGWYGHRQQPGLNVQGTTDSELLFHLALKFGLEEDVIGSFERMAGFVEQLGRSRGVDEQLQMTVGVSDGERLYAVRYASGPAVNSLFVTRDARDVRGLCPHDQSVQQLSDAAHAIVSEPLDDLPERWIEVPPATAVILEPGASAHLPFTPRSAS